MKGNEQDCICHKPNFQHTKKCDAYRLSEFVKKSASATEAWEDVKNTEPWVSIEGVLWDFQAKQFTIESCMNEIHEHVTSLLSSQKNTLMEKIRQLPEHEYGDSCDCTKWFKEQILFILSQ